MQKIPTLFVRDPDDRAHVLPQVAPGQEWVLSGLGRPTRKWDGTCLQLDLRGRWWARREVKPAKAEPANFRLAELDRVTGKRFGWEPLEQSPFKDYANDAIRALGGVARPGTYELIGPKINGNPEKALRHTVVQHGIDVFRELDGVIFTDQQTAYDQLSAYVLAAHQAFGVEGVVWHHPDGRMAKLKARDLIVEPEVDLVDA